jgi:serine/threonine-protein kinase PRP4
VALKVVNNREPMRKAGEREVEVLRTLFTRDPGGRQHTVRLQHVCQHAGHLCLAFEPLAANLKEVADKFGKGVGVPLGAVRVYAGQLLRALGLVGGLGYVHGDLKPHNILASADYRMLKLGDFGSAFRWASEPDAEAPQPYAGSRFYRAPEAILGGRCCPAWDMWSAACLLFELYTGGPLFPGLDNNDMLWRVQQLRGPFAHRALRRHVAAVGAVGAEALELHFDPPTLAFRRRVCDPVTREVGVKLVTVSAPSESLGARLQASRAGDSRRAVGEFQALLEHMLVLDPARRCSVEEALGSAFLKGV